jgi:hypothetical protein
MLVLKRTSDGKYVAKPGSKNSYTKYLQHARVFRTREEAERDRCPENERIVEVQDEF